MSALAAAPRPDARTTESLAAWLYTDPAFFALERERLFRTTWQAVCHVNDIPAAGDYQAFDFLDERVVTLRGDHFDPDAMWRAVSREQVSDRWLPCDALELFQRVVRERHARSGCTRP